MYSIYQYNQYFKCEDEAQRKVYSYMSPRAVIKTKTSKQN